MIDPFDQLPAFAKARLPTADTADLEWSASVRTPGDARADHEDDGREGPPPRPAALPFRVEGIPASLLAEPRWVIWHYTWREENGKPGAWTKPPYIATAPAQKADSTDPTTWRSFADAQGAYEDGKCDGIGFVLGDGYIGFDADGTDASDCVSLLNTYAERSPSGNGVHAIARGTKPGTRSRTGAYELYDHGRYFTVTGHHVAGTPTTVEERTAEIATLYARLFPNGNGAAPTTAPSSSTLTDDTLIAKASTSRKSGAKFAKLWAGDITDYQSHSEADLALCSLLAFWTNRDAAQTDRLFRRSGLMREKWDRVGADLIAKAIASTSNGYAEDGRQVESAAIVVHRASDVPDEKLEKLFGGRLVRGSFALVAGPGEGGKGMFMVDTAARFTTGTPFPGEKARRDPAAVLLCVTEDSQGRVKSRLRAAGANLDLAFFVEGPEVTRGGLTMASPMMLDDDAGKLVSYARQIKAQACLIETMVEHFGDRGGKASRRSTNNEADVRSALSPFRAMCAAASLYGEASIHPRKTMEGSIDDSISGSAAFRNVTRIAHHIYRDPEDESDNPVRLLFTSKSNYLSRRPTTLRFRIRSWDEGIASPCMCPIDNCGHEGRIVWEDDLVDKRLAEEIWQQIAERNRPRRDVNVQEAEAFLTGLMKDGIIALAPVEIFKLASAEGITKASVKRAKEKLRLVSKKDGFPAVVVGWQVEKEQL